MQKFYRQIFVFEVLGNEPLPETCDPQDLFEATMNGHYSGDMKSVETVEVTKEQMKLLLEAQRSDPSFLIDEDEE